MATIAQDVLYHLSLIKYDEKFDVTKAAVKYKTYKQYITASFANKAATFL